jgi:hypothetical protein
MSFPANITGQVAEAAVPRQKAVMGKAIPSQQPAVVLRSQFDQLHALLAIALVAGIGLTIAVVILARDSGDVSSTSSAKPIESINYGDSRFVNPSTGYPSVPLTVGASTAEQRRRHPLRRRPRGGHPRHRPRPRAERPL